MTPSEIIVTARYILNDAAATYRQSDAELLGYVNDGIYEISGLRPELFMKVGDYTCVPSQCEQAVTFDNCQLLGQVLAIHGGAAVTPFDIGTMDAFNPAWRLDTPAATTQWSKYPGDPLRFFVYPAAPATTQVLDIQYVKVPATLALLDTITEVPARMWPALVNYVVYRAYSKDDEHSESGRSAAEYGAFMASVKGG